MEKPAHIGAPVSVKNPTVSSRCVLTTPSPHTTAMKKKIALAAFLAVPGSFAILALACLHPVLRRELARAAGLEPVFANVSRQVVLLALVYHLNMHHRHRERAVRACLARGGVDCDVFAQ
ncbi:hypothetical protein PCO31010_02136 [Pandoraea commovens]|uniref:Uncharacterized protein n=2 Tax=Pandoraea commovens TaxID=2508289 RepID=A0A5E4UPB1_9BURK|nr:hypothetical protein PCO31010_02136 [Pandoraea commovens]